jgi:hypothetical protein
MTRELAQLLDDLPADVGAIIRKLLAEIDEMICKAEFEHAEHLKKLDAQAERFKKLQVEIEETRKELFAAALERFEPRGNA